MKRLAIVSATVEEQRGIVEALDGRYTQVHAGRDFVMGHFRGVPVVCVLCGIGKVAAAVTTTLLISRFGVSHIVFTGVAGSGNQFIDIGDIVVGNQVAQHDMDCTPMYDRYLVPGYQSPYFEVNEELSIQLYSAVVSFCIDGLQKIPLTDREEFGILLPNVFCGTIVTGDQFVRHPDQLEAIQAGFPDVAAIEMEGGAIGQVCNDLGIPFAIMRTISDKSNDESPINYPKFIEKVASQYAYGILERFCDLLAEQYFKKA